MPETTRLATTIETWWPHVLVFLQLGVTNARTEGFNRIIKQVKRTGFNRPSPVGQALALGTSFVQPVEVLLEAGDDAGMPGGFAVPAPALRVIA